MLSYSLIGTVLVSSRVVASFRRGWAVLSKLSAHYSPSADSSSQPYQWCQEGEIGFSSRFWPSGLPRKNFPEFLFWNPSCNLPLFPVVFKSYLLLSRPQLVATLSYLLFVNRNMVIQSNLNFKRRLAHSGVGSGENAMELIRFAYFLLQFQVTFYWSVVLNCVPKALLFLCCFAVFLLSFSGFTFI